MGSIGTAVGIVFFITVFFAALTSSVSILEAIVSSVMDKFHMNRNKATIMVGLITLVIGLVVCLGYNLFYFEAVLANTPAGSSAQILDILDYISKSKAIVDFQGDWQHGITLRPLEALFYGKKLITNSKEVEKMDFYRPGNVFCTYKDDISNINKFLDSPLEVIPDEVIKKYDLTGWVERFQNKKDEK